MPTIRVLILWHQHQPYYKDLVSGSYRLPWVRMHALKDYFGMVKLLDEFPNVHPTINLVPSLMVQIEDYAAGTANDPFLALAAMPAAEMSPEDRARALTYLFQANAQHMIGRYPRFRELWEMTHGVEGGAAAAQRHFSLQDLTDLQVLSQLAWFDEYFLAEPDVAALVEKGRGFTLDEQALIITKQRELVGRVLPAHRSAVERGMAEVSTTPFYHPILPLVCDTAQGKLSSPGITVPQRDFRHPEDAREQLLRSVALYERLFGSKPKGCWPSEGSVSEEALALAHSCGFQWMASDEGVLGRSLGVHFVRDQHGILADAQAAQLYNIYRYQRDDANMHLVFRDHALSDLIGFVYASVDPKEAADDMLQRIHRNAAPVLASGRDAIVPIILDGENAWEFYPRSGREFLRRLYDGLDRDPQIEALTLSEAIARHADFAPLHQLTPGSWINANFNVWIGAPEDNLAWDLLHDARDFYAAHAPNADAAARELAYQEILIAEGSDWNWWYGPEHHSANDTDFDELYRKHLANVYTALGAEPPEALAHSICGSPRAASVITPQSAFIYPSLTGAIAAYFDWLGAASYFADERSSAMHGKESILHALHAGINETHLFARLDCAGGMPRTPFSLQLNLQYVDGDASPDSPATNASSANGDDADNRAALGKSSGVASFKLRLDFAGGVLQESTFTENGDTAHKARVDRTTNDHLTTSDEQTKSDAGTTSDERAQADVPTSDLSSRATLSEAKGSRGILVLASSERMQRLKDELRVRVLNQIELSLPLAALRAAAGSQHADSQNAGAQHAGANQAAPTEKQQEGRAAAIRLRAYFFRDKLPVDLIPAEGWLELPLISHEEMSAHLA